DEHIFDIEKLGGTLDLNAGQAVDRVGVKLGLTFPCGAELEKLAAAAEGERIPRVTPSVHGLDCNLSGVENKAAKLIADGSPASVTAMYTLNYIKYTLGELTKNALAEHPSLPVLYAGGVMSNGYIKKYLGGLCEAYFAQPCYSSDNAAGTALLCAYKFTK
ncbi:MAG: peptidase M22, partial [Eubacteriales bacterium]